MSEIAEVEAMRQGECTGTQMGILCAISPFRKKSDLKLLLT